MDIILAILVGATMLEAEVVVGIAVVVVVTAVVVVVAVIVVVARVFFYSSLWCPMNPLRKAIEMSQSLILTFFLISDVGLLNFLAARTSRADDMKAQFLLGMKPQMVAAIF